LMSKLMPWITLVAPKFFSMPWNDTDAMFSVPRSVDQNEAANENPNERG
jgi:hypothetical protein